ncbi:unnamed protein product [Brachionus calyciflorus]|uniref:Major facilitator superfamily (MFS) profile domain-containing protein n=1 Tax=Brachionus calyciflorus TaxID=104777 RepID=A0A813XD70_9BILA|nr:unnamed protein product [Brachionus calyciflorus]
MIQNETVGSDKILKEKRAEALHKLDNAKFGWFHIKACLVSGIGFFTDAYDLFIINLAMLMMGCVYFKDAPGHEKNRVPVYIDTLVKASGQIGTLIGQLLFGILADHLGRKRMYGVELMIIIVSTCASALSASTVSGLSVFAVLAIWRIFLGLGIGGDYPLSATITSEFASTKRRGAMMAAVFAMQGFGILAASLVAIALLACFKNAVNANQDNLDYVWRLCIGFGAIPGLISIYFRMTIPETPRYTIDVDDDIERAINDVDEITEGHKHKLENHHEAGNKASFKDFCRHFSQWKNLKILLGTSVSWFALDVGFYGINLNTGIIIEAIGFSGNIETDPWNCLFKDAIGNLIIALMGLVPGYWFTVFLVDKMGRKTIQIIGFVALTVLLLVLGIAYNQIKNFSIALFIVIFTLMQFFQNFGPNTTTFIIPGEVFPTRYRSTAHGISAAAGKLGAIVSQVGFFQLKDIGGKNKSIPTILIIFGGFMFIGLLFTLLLPETKGKSLEELAGEVETQKENEDNSNGREVYENKIESF